MVSVNVVEVRMGVKLVLYAEDLYMIVKNNATWDQPNLVDKRRRWKIIIFFVDLKTYLVLIIKNLGFSVNRILDLDTHL